jgi:hypothetical protein
MAAIVCRNKKGYYYYFLVGLAEIMCGTTKPCGIIADVCQKQFHMHLLYKTRI